MNRHNLNAREYQRRTREMGAYLAILEERERHCACCFCRRERSGVKR